METAIISILTLLLGWILAVANDHVRGQALARATARKAIADLLQARHLLRGYTTGIEAYRKRIPVEIPIHMEIEMRKLVTKQFGLDSSFVTRFRNTVDTLAEFDPLLSFRLKGKEDITSLISALHDASTDDPEHIRFIISMEKILLDGIVPHLTEVILDTAGALDWRLRRRIKRYFENEGKPDSGFDALLDCVESTINKQINNPKPE